MNPALPPPDLCAMKNMKAMAYTTYGGPEVLQPTETTIPTPKANEVLIRVHAAAVTGSDLMMRQGAPWIGRLYLGINKPKRTILGYDFAGEVAEVGEGVTAFKTGDRVFGGTTTLGSYAEYTCVSVDDVIATMPENLTYEQAAPVCGSAVTVMNFLKGKAALKPGQKVLINGASGSLGTYAVQIAKHFGAHVTGVCSTGNVAMVQALGADVVIDYTREDFTKNGVLYDVIFDTVGKRSFSECEPALAPDGMYLSSGLSLPLLMSIIRTSIAGGKKAWTSSTGMLPAKERLDYLLEVREMLDKKAITTVVDKQYRLDQLPEAHAYVELGHKKGNVVIMAV